MPAGKTDQVQPIDRGLGRHLKIYMGKEEHEWLEDDDNLQKYENNELTASDRRILIATWYCKAFDLVCESEALAKYFLHAGGLLTADGSDDNLITLEGVPKGKTIIWDDDELDASQQRNEPLEVVPDPDDVGPRTIPRWTSLAVTTSSTVRTKRTRTMPHPRRAWRRQAFIRLSYRQRAAARDRAHTKGRDAGDAHRLLHALLLAECGLVCGCSTGGQW